jgi:hypothetical protein
VILVLSSCAAMEVPGLVEEPVPDQLFLKQTTFDTPCPSFSGVFSRVPEIAILATDGTWKVELGQDFTYALVLPLEIASIQVFDPKDAGMKLAQEQIFVDSVKPNDQIRFILFNKKHERFESYSLSIKNGDYICEDGSLVFPEFVVSGGGEGFTLNARTYRRASISSKSDFYVYEQISGYKQTHKFFRFERGK